MSNDFVKVSVLLNDQAIRTISLYCEALGTNRKNMIQWMSERVPALKALDVSVAEPDPEWCKVQSTVHPKLLKIFSKRFKADSERDKLKVMSCLFNHILQAEIIPHETLNLPADFVGTLIREGLRWFQFAQAVGHTLDEVLEVDDVWLYGIDPQADDSLLCTGGFTHHVVEPYLFGFSGRFHNGELHLDTVLPSY